MSFPTTSVLSNFTGADEDPISEGGNWYTTGPFRFGGVLNERLSNQTVRDQDITTGDSGSLWQVAQYGPDSEVFATIAALPGAGENVTVWCRIHNPGNATTAEGYLGQWINGTGWNIYKMLTGSDFTEIGTTAASPSPIAGDKIGLEVIGTTLNLYHYTGGAWNLRVTGTDSSISGAGYIGLEFGANATEAAFDDFGGGTIAIPNPPIGILSRGSGW